MALKPLGGPAPTDPPQPSEPAFSQFRPPMTGGASGSGSGGPGIVLPGPGSKPAEPKTSPGPVVRPPPTRPKPVKFRRQDPPGTLPVDPPAGQLSGGSGSGGTYESGLSRAQTVRPRSGGTRYSNPVHPSSARRRFR